MRIHYLQHVPFENPGTILSWAAAQNHSITCTKMYKNVDLPEISEFDWLIIMGGPMNIYQENRYPWLSIEKKFIEQTIHENKLVLGLCLGAQLIADVIGGRVLQNKYKEIGWFRVELSQAAADLHEFAFLPKNPVVFEWHGDTFVDLPDEAILLASNGVCQNQAFLYKDRVYGFQFHLENTSTIIENLIQQCTEDLEPGPFVQQAQTLLSGSEFMKQDNCWMSQFLTRIEEKWNNMKNASAELR